MCAKKIKLLTIVFCFIFVTHISDVHSCCSFTPIDGEKSQTYVCLNSTFSDLDEIAAEAEWIEFSISHNLEVLQSDAFAKFSKLQRLTFYNSHISEIKENAFRGLSNLRWLIFSGTEILVARKKMFSHLNKLEKLVIEDANLSYIEPEVYRGLSNLRELSLKNNALNYIDIDDLKHLMHLKSFSFDGNTLTCRCHEELVRYLKDRNISFEDGLEKYKENIYQCMIDVKVSVIDVSKYILEVLPFAETSENYMGGLVESTDAAPLDDLPYESSLIAIVGIRIVSLYKYTFFRFGNTLRSLELRQCKIASIEEHTFAGLNHLMNLTLIGNELSKIEDNWFLDLVSLKRLILDENGIEEIGEDAFNGLKNLEFLSLHGNKLHCLSINTLKPLKFLYSMELLGNPLDCNCRDNLKNHLTNNQIEFEISFKPCSSYYHTVENYGDTWHYEKVKLKPRHIGRTYGIPFGKLIYISSKPAITSGEILQLPALPSKFVDTLQNLTFKPVLAGGTCIKRSDKSYQCCSVRFLSELDKIPDQAKIIHMIRTSISLMPLNYLTRFRDTLKVLHFYNCDINRIPYNLLQNLHVLEELSFRENRLEVIEGDVFSSLTNLRTIDLSHNLISAIPDDFYRALPTLRSLHLEHNELSCIPVENFSKCFRHLKNLTVSQNPLSCLCSAKIEEFLIQRNISYDPRYLMKINNYKSRNCHRNQIHQNLTIFMDAPKIPENRINEICYANTLFEDVKYLSYGGNVSLLDTIPPNTTSIEIHNGHIPVISRNAFVRFENLHELILNRCNLKKLEEGWFNGLSKLTSLNLQQNRLGVVPSDNLEFPNLKILNLRANDIGSIENGAFRSLGNLEELYLEYNQISCLFTAELRNLGKLKILQLIGNRLNWRCQIYLEEYLDDREVAFARIYDEKEYNRVASCASSDRSSCGPWVRYEPGFFQTTFIGIVLFVISGFLLYFGVRADQKRKKKPARV